MESGCQFDWSERFSTHGSMLALILCQRSRSISGNLMPVRFQLINFVMYVKEKYIDTKLFTRIIREFSEIAVYRFHFRCSHYGIQSAQSMSHQPQVFTWSRNSGDGHLSVTFKLAQSVDTGRSCQLSPTEVETAYWQNFLISDDTYTSIYVHIFFDMVKTKIIKVSCLLSLPLSASSSGTVESQLHFT